MPNPPDQPTRPSTRRRRLARLRDLMRSACDLEEPVAYFLDQLARDPLFCEGSASGDPGLDPILQAIALCVFGPGGVVGERSFRCLDGLWHGRCAFDSGDSLVLYHCEVDVGIVDMPLDGGRAFLRFTTRSWKMWPAARPPPA
jgi:hypothetical protein